MLIYINIYSSLSQCYLRITEKRNQKNRMCLNYLYSCFQTINMSCSRQFVFFVPSSFEDVYSRKQKQIFLESVITYKNNYVSFIFTYVLNCLSFKFCFSTKNLGTKSIIRDVTLTHGSSSLHVDVGHFGEPDRSTCTSRYRSAVRQVILHFAYTCVYVCTRKSK